jgi:DNA invertase Pin-like site-specific DNA recombinase
MQNRAMREHATRRGWTIALQVHEVGSGGTKREMRERDCLAWRRPDRMANAWAGRKRPARHSAEIRELHRAGISKSEIARRLQVGRTLVRHILTSKST